jgi:hypothetical protein
MPENNNNELKMSTIHDGTRRTGNGVEGLMRWVRLLMPMAIAGIGWYLGHTIGQFQESLIGLDDRIDVQEINCAARESEYTVKFSDIMRRLERDEERDIREHSNLIERPQYQRELDHIRDELHALEELHTEG